jgi:isopenicillin-N epimerase
MDTAAEHRKLWLLSPELTHLNHGSYGACPNAVLEYQRAVREECERSPDRFFNLDLEHRFYEAKGKLAAFVGAKNENIVFLRNATHGVNTVLRHMPFKPGDEILITDHGYNACRNAAAVAAKLAGAAVVTAHIPFPIAGDDAVIEALVQKITPRTKLLIIDHITSPTAVIFPVKRIIAECKRRGIEVLVDGAHAPGQIPLDVGALGAAYYTGNCHKWMCAPKSAGFLYVSPERQAEMLPLVTSHGETAADRSHARYQLRFQWPGTDDPSAFLSVPAAIACMGRLYPGGWSELMAKNHALACEGRAAISRRLSLEPLCPDAMCGSMACLPVPDRLVRFIESLPEPKMDHPSERFRSEPRWRFWHYLMSRHHVDALTTMLPGDARYFLRISAQAYVSPHDFAKLAEILASLGA